MHTPSPASSSRRHSRMQHGTHSDGSPVESVSLGTPLRHSFTDVLSSPGSLQVLSIPQPLFERTRRHEAAPAEVSLSRAVTCSFQAIVLALADSRSCTGFLDLEEPGGDSSRFWCHFPAVSGSFWLHRFSSHVEFPPSLTNVQGLTLFGYASRNKGLKLLLHESVNVTTMRSNPVAFNEYNHPGFCRRPF
jgi:hypothetical protein